MEEVSVKLQKSIEFHGARITEISLRRPSASDYFELLEPRTLARSPDGTVYWIEVPQSIKGYVDRCLQGEHGAALLPLLTLRDARRIKEAVLGFFDSDMEMSPS